MNHVRSLLLVQDNGLDLVKEVQLSGTIQDLAYSPDQKYIAAADSNRKVIRSSWI
jgi:hypothetical protein